MTSTLTPCSARLSRCSRWGPAYCFRRTRLASPRPRGSRSSGRVSSPTAPWARKTIGRGRSGLAARRSERGNHELRSGLQLRLLRLLENGYAAARIAYRTSRAHAGLHLNAEKCGLCSGYGSALRRAAAVTGPRPACATRISRRDQRVRPTWISKSGVDARRSAARPDQGPPRIRPHDAGTCWR
jgi:hypothetical protein